MKGNNKLGFAISLKRGDFLLSAKAEIPMQGITALKGPSGSGKTSLLRVIAGLEPTTRGEMSARGKTWLSDRLFLPPQKRRIGYVFQNARLFTHMTVAQNLAYGWQRQGVSADVLTRVHQALHLEPILNRPVEGLSGGERQRVAIGRALASDPQLMLLDEPLSGLDSDQRAETLTYIAQALAAAEVPAIYVSHFQREIDRIADRLLCIDAGQTRPLRDLPAPLKALVVARMPDGQARLSLGGTTFAMPCHGAPGQEVWLRVSADDVMLSRNDPGQSSALLSLPAKLIEMRNTAEDSCLGKAGGCIGYLTGKAWELELPLSPDQVAQMNLTCGSSVWVSFAREAFLPVVSKG